MFRFLGIILPAAFVALGLSGCGTLRTMKDPNPDGSWIYSGVRDDFSVISDKLKPPVRNDEAKTAALAFLDLPFSAVADTVRIAPMLILEAAWSGLKQSLFGDSNDESDDTTTPPPPQEDTTTEMHRLRGDETPP